jgi:hypothetical protein
MGKEESKDRMKEIIGEMESRKKSMCIFASHASGFL